MTEVVLQNSDRKKISFSTSGAGTNGYPFRGKNETGTLSYTIYKNQLQVNQAPKYEREKLQSFLKREKKDNFCHLKVKHRSLKQDTKTLTKKGKTEKSNIKIRTF